jgi:hypothetical protein
MADALDSACHFFFDSLSILCLQFGDKYGITIKTAAHAAKKGENRMIVYSEVSEN